MNNLFKFSTNAEYQSKLLSGDLDNKHTVCYVTGTDTVKYDEENPLSGYTLLYSKNNADTTSTNTKQINITQTYSDVKLIIDGNIYNTSITNYSLSNQVEDRVGYNIGNYYYEYIRYPNQQGQSQTNVSYWQSPVKSSANGGSVVKVYIKTT